MASCIVLLLIPGRPSNEQPVASTAVSVTDIRIWKVYLLDEIIVFLQSVCSLLLIMDTVFLFHRGNAVNNSRYSGG